MDANGHAALSHVLHDATSSVVEQLHAQLQEKERKIRELDRQLALATCIRAIVIDKCAEALCKIDELDQQLARATYIRARQGAKLRRLRRPRINPQATD